jgi:hypothetical protein
LKTEKRNFAYDDAFRTMTVECDDLVLPLLNHMFGESYDAQARVSRLGNESFLRDPEGGEHRRITDSRIEVEFRNQVKKYHLECESSPFEGSMLVRMFEYDSLMAKEDREGDDLKLTFHFPHSGLLELRNTDRKPSEAFIELVTPGGSVSYPVKILYESDFSLDIIFEKKLYFLLPFYIFNYEKQLKTINDDSEELEKMGAMYEGILSRLAKEADAHALSAFSKDVIIMLIEHVIRKLAENHESIQRKVGDLMGGQVLDLDIIRIKHEAETIGEARGEVKAKENGIRILIQDNLEEGKSEEVILEKLMRRYDLKESEAMQYFKRFSKPE